MLLFLKDFMISSLYENGETIYKTKYDGSPEFVYDLQNDNSLTIKGFVRTGTEADYEQTSYKLPAVEILGIKKYALASTSVPDNIDELLIEALPLFGNTTLPAESVRKEDGSAWETDLSLPVDWTCPDISLRSYGTYVNGFWFLDDIFREYLLEGNESDGKIIISYMLGFFTKA